MFERRSGVSHFKGQIADMASYSTARRSTTDTAKVSYPYDGRPIASNRTFDEGLEKHHRWPAEIQDGANNTLMQQLSPIHTQAVKHSGTDIVIGRHQFRVNDRNSISELKKVVCAQNSPITDSGPTSTLKNRPTQAHETVPRSAH